MVRMIPEHEYPPALEDLSVIETPAQAYDLGYDAGRAAYFANATSWAIYNCGSDERRERIEGELHDDLFAEYTDRDGPTPMVP